MEGNFTPGRNEMPPNTGSFRLNQGIYDSISSSVEDRWITYAEWVNIMRAKINEFNPFCAYVNKYHHWNKAQHSTPILFQCKLYCKFIKCTSTCEIIHYKGDDVLFNFELTGQIVHSNSVRQRARLTGEKKTVCEMN